ncbi:16S rRNA (cytidine(1402)-2'-O)-methyltransferase [Butyricicoccus porcorum]|uniref:Ribosomal RNA small subunit methyltransferase I n=1 Tax=Butyricicoccus porcorum TaxID=1945634 RepID=A0A252F4R4_9FIRM|nr:16S rRNA (cytidine(1402)-2'-O)-methyltransferase [Butyricicoccus porcorum]MCI6926478.1 16S rRNA (cytidine(1402)-2'-O)-methyltransferase [Butyricicoccus porcorum]MDD6987249.1 16S rRNA (cytidine(1402)-2'-O)-methyltransferase [Butyricicoccus porcorum]MDY4483745.1 16S rRNA (cytidine(1402)-2'-O)-methyltransferase [Butyricicoccus porcorum]OUM20766.1 16S rRNA (cytidine(1402)-2'-O)-methyltransferase [Butyricicoccus porcorum]
MGTGTLYLVGTPIGNLEDLTYRAVRILKEADFVAAEDTRVSGKLLHYLEISKPLVSYHEHNRKQRGPELVQRMLAGETCALVTDAGMPAVSDPGEDLANLCHEAGIPVIPVPGACAAVCALAQSGLPSGKWCFEGFLPPTGKQRRERLEVLKTEPRTCIVYEAPHRLRMTLRDLAETLGDRRVSLARELTKLHEECLRMTLPEAAAYYEEQEPRGEYVLVIEGAQDNPEQSAANQMAQAIQLTEELTAAGLTLRDAVKQAAKQTGARKNQLYQTMLAREKGE